MPSSYTAPRIGTKSFSLVANAFLQAEDASMLAMLAKSQHLGIAYSRIGHRPDRVQPRAIKRRPKAHKF